MVTAIIDHNHYHVTHQYHHHGIAGNVFNFSDLVRLTWPSLRDEKVWPNWQIYGLKHLGALAISKY